LPVLRNWRVLPAGLREQHRAELVARSDGVSAKLKSGAKVADVGCGVGFSTLLMARAFPQSRFVGYDFHAPSIAEANRHAVSHGLDDRVSFKEASAKDIKESGYDLVTCFDCLHDMGDPKGCAGHMHRILKADGTWMIVEPIAGDRPQDNMNPVGRLYYNASTMICVPTSLDQEVGEGLGAQAGEAKLSEVIRGAGSPRFEEQRRGRSTWSLRLGPSLSLVPVGAAGLQ
jgi:ubiquinone/menaquinone biosynthesis C-methylase UbiE